MMFSRPRIEASSLTTVLEDLREVEQKEFWPALLDKGCISFQWENVVAYYTEYCSKMNSLDEHLVVFLQRNSDGLVWTWDGLCNEIGTDEANTFYRKLIQCTELSKYRYRAALKPIGAYDTSFLIKELPDEYVEILIELGIIAVTVENVTSPVFAR